MLIDAILKLHDDIKTSKLGSQRRDQIESEEQLALTATPTSEMRGLLP
jgi:NADH-quinone oxidoreductase subunit B